MARTESGEMLGTRSSHNTLLSILAEQGIPGTLLALGLFTAAYRQLRRMHPPDMEELAGTLGTYRAAVAGCLSCVLVAGMFTDFLKAEVFIWFIGLLAALNDLTRRATQTVPVESSPEVPSREDRPARTPRSRQLPPAATPRLRR